MKQIYAASLLAVEFLWKIPRKRSVAIRFYGFTLFCLAIMLSWSGTLSAQSGTSPEDNSCACENNLISNPSFEKGNTDGWGTQGGNFYVGNGYEVCGDYNAYLYARNSAAWAYHDMLGPVAGTKLTLSFWAGTHDPRYNHFVRLAFYKSDWDLIAVEGLSVEYDVDRNGDLKNYTFDAEVPNGTSYMSVEAYSSGDYLKLDMLCLTTDQDNNSVLPIELNDFSARLTAAQQVRLDWETETELNNDFFLIERSQDGKQWIKVATEPGAGTSYHPLQYSLLDENPLTGLSYYRLKQTDFDGTFSYSDIVSVQLDKKVDLKALKYQVFPNPATDMIFVDIAEEANVELLDALGRRLDIPAQSASAAGMTLPLTGLSPGIYYLRIRAEDQQVTEKIIIE